MTIEVGTRVVIKPYAEYRNKYNGCVGTVDRCYTQKQKMIGVLLDNVRNKSSGYGVFWFSVDKIEIIESEEQKEMLQGYVTAGIKFLDGQNTDTEYYYALYDETICTGDTVVVKTKHHGIALAVVSSIGEYNTDAVKCGREIINKVDFSAYEERCAKVQRISDLKHTLDSKVKEYQQNAIYEMVAEKDPTMASFLREYKELLNID